MIEELRKYFQEKGLAETSIRTYLRNLEKLNDDQPFKTLAFLKNVNAIDEKLSGYKANTKKNYLISICSALSKEKEHSVQKRKLYDTYYDKMMALNKQIKEIGRAHV